MKRTTKALALLLSLVCILAAFASCRLNVGGDDQNGGGDRTEEGGWENVNFDGQEVRFCISINKYNEVTFPAADIYTRGPDTAGSNEVYKEVLARNKKATEELGIKIVYSETDLRYDEVLEDVRTVVQTAACSSFDRWKTYGA